MSKYRELALQYARQYRRNVTVFWLMAMLGCVGVFVSMQYEWIVVGSTQLPGSFVGEFSHDDISMNVTYAGYETVGGKLTMIVAGIIFLLLVIPRETVGFIIFPVFFSLALFVGPIIEWVNMRQPYTRVGENDVIVQFVHLHDGSAGPYEVVQFGDGLTLFLLSGCLLFMAVSVRFLHVLSNRNF